MMLLVTHNLPNCGFRSTACKPVLFEHKKTWPTLVKKNPSQFIEEVKHKIKRLWATLCVLVMRFWKLLSERQQLQRRMQSTHTSGSRSTNSTSQESISSIKGPNPQWKQPCAAALEILYNFRTCTFLLNLAFSKWGSKTPRGAQRSARGFNVKLFKNQ